MIEIVTIQAAKAIGVDNIIAVDIVPQRLELAQELGAKYTINSKGMSKEDLALAIRSLPIFNGDASPFGPYGIVDTTGHPFMIQGALSAVNRLGKVVQLANHGYDHLRGTRDVC